MSKVDKSDIMKAKCSGYDMTMPCSKYPDVASVKDFLRNTMEAKNFIFQKEKGAQTGYLHWQVRLRLRQSTRVKTVINKARYNSCRASVTTNRETEIYDSRDFQYVLKKDETFVEGPFTDRNDDSVEETVKAAKDEEHKPDLTTQLEEFLPHTLYPWQQQVMEMCLSQDFRSIKVIFDPVGHNGKSIFSEYLEWKGYAYEIPPMISMEDIMQCVMSVPGKKCYLVDMPRAMKKDKLAGFYAGLEALKNGVAYDKRHHFRKVRFNRPQIIVFTNRLPDVTLMSRDRWEIFEMQPNKTLVPMSGPSYSISEESLKSLVPSGPSI